MKYEVGGSHYKSMDIQPIEFILKNNLGFCEGNVVKYITRYRHKNGKEDLLKAIHYIELLIESEYGKEGNEKENNSFDCVGISTVSNSRNVHNGKI